MIVFISDQTKHTYIFYISNFDNRKLATQYAISAILVSFLSILEIIFFRQKSLEIRTSIINLMREKNRYTHTHNKKERLSKRFCPHSNEITRQAGRHNSIKYTRKMRYLKFKVFFYFDFLSIILSAFTSFNFFMIRRWQIFAEILYFYVKNKCDSLFIYFAKVITFLMQFISACYLHISFLFKYN